MENRKKNKHKEQKESNREELGETKFGISKMDPSVNVLTPTEIDF